jgi:uncharacterized protein YcbX
VTDQQAPRVTAIHRYPVKGLSPEPLSSVTLAPGQTLPFDRTYAIENGPGRFNPEEPKHLPKIVFLMLMRDERLATLKTRFDDASGVLTIERDGRQVARGQLTTPLGRSLIEQFLAAYMKAELRGPPKVVSASGHHFTDISAKAIHIINLATLREVERAAGRPLDPLRFRPNVQLDGFPPWVEFNWLNQEIMIGSSRVAIFARTTRCEATNVDPATGARDTAIPAVLQRTWSHSDFGIYGRVVSGGEIAIGSRVEGPGT